MNLDSDFYAWKGSETNQLCKQFVIGQNVYFMQQILQLLYNIDGVTSLI